MKIYNNDKKKFTGEIYDIFNIKLRVFYNYYAKVGLSDIQYYNAFLVMLKGRAATVTEWALPELSSHWLADLPCPSSQSLLRDAKARA
jgi:hypothetical protein